MSNSTLSLRQWFPDNNPKYLKMHQGISTFKPKFRITVNNALYFIHACPWYCLINSRDSQGELKFKGKYLVFDKINEHLQNVNYFVLNMVPVSCSSSCSHCDKKKATCSFVIWVTSIL